MRPCRDGNRNRKTGIDQHLLLREYAGGGVKLILRGQHARIEGAEKRKHLAKLAAALGLLVVSTSAWAGWYHGDDDGVWWECWHVDYQDQLGRWQTEVQCQLLDHMPPLQP